jgi:hypothetical protein
MGKKEEGNWGKGKGAKGKKDNRGTGKKDTGVTRGKRTEVKEATDADREFSARLRTG